MPKALSPIISIVIPTYEMKGQGVAFLKRCLDSIEKQLLSDPALIEVRISDQSVDHEIEHFVKRFTKDLITNQPDGIAVHYHRTTTGKGIAAHNLNCATGYAQGSFVKILFQDDLLVEDYYLTTVLEQIAQDDPDCIMSAATHTQDGITFFNPMTPVENPYFLFGNNTASSPSVLTVRKSILAKIAFDEHLKLLFDCDFYYQVFAQKLKVRIINSIHIANGIWEGQSQFGISPEVFSKEVRYLNWKFPKAKLENFLPQYQAYFSKRHPEAPFPFSTQLEAGFLQQWWWRQTRKRP
jgi:glycosyltransferase involved in cell wall biosynthesis